MKLLTLAALSVVLGFSQSNDCDTLDMDKPGSANCTSATGTNQEVNREKRPSWIYPPTILGCNSKHYENAANEFREVLNGDLEPKWTEVWAHISLGKIYDVTNQRDRALTEYRLALKTKDNTRGALDEAKKYTQAPYKPN